MRTAARALRISHSNMLTSPGRVASAGHWCPSAVMHYAFIRSASFSVTAPICGGSVSRSSLVTPAKRPSCGRVNAGEPRSISPPKAGYSNLARFLVVTFDRCRGAADSQKGGGP